MSLNFKKLYVLFLCSFVICFFCNLSVISNVYASNTVKLDTNELTYKSGLKGTKSYGYVFDNDGKLLAKSVYDQKTGTVLTNDYTIDAQFKSNVNSIEYGHPSSEELLDSENVLLSKSKYKKISTHEGTLNIAGYSTIGIIAAIVAITGGVAASVVGAIASAAISQHCSKLKYTVTIYGYNVGKTHHYKRVFKFYNKKTGKKLGPTITTYNTTHK